VIALVLASIKTDSSPYRKPTADIYTVLLAVALAALLAAMVYLYLDMSVDQMQLSPPRLSMIAAPAAGVALARSVPLSPTTRWCPERAGVRG
jgi:zinc transporter ZupT